MTLGRVPGPCHRGPGKPRPGPACLPLSQLTRPQHCLSDRPVLGPQGQLHFPRWLPACPPHQLTGSHGAEGGWVSAAVAAPCCSGAVTWVSLGKWLVLKAALGLIPIGEEMCPVVGALLHGGACGTVSLPRGL